MAEIRKVSSLGMPELDPYVRLSGAQLRSRLAPREALIIAESPNVILTAIDSGYIPVSLLTDERLLRGEVARLIERIDALPFGEDLPVYVGERELLRSITGFELTRGALAALRRPPEPSLDEVLAGAKRIAVLEEIADSTNVGAIFRSAAALGIDAVLITPTCCDPYCRRAIRVSMGTVFAIPWTRICDTPDEWPGEGLKLLRKHGFSTVAMALSLDSVAIDDERLAAEEKLAIILGTEGTGLKTETISSADHVARIPMSRGVDSLNVGAAAAIAFFQLGDLGKK